MPEIVAGRTYVPEEAAGLLGVGADELRRCLFERGHTDALTAAGFTASQLEEGWKALRPYIIAGVPDAGRVSGEDEAALRLLWQEAGAVTTPNTVQFRFATEHEARAAAAALPPYPGFTWGVLRLEPGENGCQKYAAGG